MRKILCLGAMAVLLASFQGCATVAAPVMGGIYTDVVAPGAATALAASPKKGEASCQSILGLVATGDASIATACKNGKITKIHHVDYKANSILGIVGTFTTVVYGE